MAPRRLKKGSSKKTTRKKPSLDLTHSQYAKFDTRGLPEGFDPHKFYEYRLPTLAATADGLESFIYKYIPWSIIRSFAVAIDPLYEFKVGAHQITPANRTKWRQNASVLQLRYSDTYRDHVDYGQIPNYLNVTGCWSPFLVNISQPVLGYPQLGVPLPTQDPLSDYLKDTTHRTRLHGSEQGTLELFKGYINSPPRTLLGDRSRYQTFSQTTPDYEANCVAHGCRSQYLTYGSDQTRVVFYPTAATLSASVHNSLRTSEIAYNKALAQKHVLGLVKNWSPLKRDYNLYRNAVELRDLPRSISSLYKTLGDLKKLYVSLTSQPLTRKAVFDLKGVAKDVPGEYLSYHFGWKQTYRDLTDLYALPEKLSKRYSFLIKRAGKPTSFRSKITLSSAEKDVSGFAYSTGNIFLEETSTKSRIEREHELRLVINATFDFPPLNVPHFRWREFLERVGVVPRPTDLYNLTPWTWLIDYFTGLGNYVEIIDNINHDPNLVNWGLLTVVTRGKLITDFKSKTSMRSTITVQPNAGVTVTSYDETMHQSIFSYDCQTRSDVSTLMSMNETSVPTSLSAYQKSILGALLLQRTGESRAGSFRPRS